MLFIVAKLYFLGDLAIVYMCIFEVYVHLGVSFYHEGALLHGEQIFCGSK